MNPAPCVSAIVPARNEERTIGRAVVSLAEQPEIREIIVVNDQSSDATGEILRRLAAEQPKLHVVDAGPLPPGWVGKNHAAWLGAEKAACDWLLFTDADAMHLPGSTARALADAESSGAALVSYSPAQEMHTWWERSLIPFVFCRLSQLYSFAAANDPESPAAAANGQYLLIQRSAYEKIGGHAAVREEVLEDVALARLAKSAGIRLRFAPGDQICRVRMYATFRDMWEGWSKNLLPLITWSGQRVTPRAFLGDAVDPARLSPPNAAASRIRRSGPSAVGRPACQLRRAPAQESIPALRRPILLSGRGSLLRRFAGVGLGLRAREDRLERAGIPGSRARSQVMSRWSI